MPLTDLHVNPQWEIHPADLKKSLDQHEDLLLLDVRQLREWHTARLPTATLIPLHELAARAAAEIGQWKDKRVVTFCHHGVRSLHAAALLRQQGFTHALSLAGGIDAWSLLIDPTTPRY